MLTKREFVGDMPANKSYLIRQAYWWVFTYPGERVGCVVEIRESKGHGATVKVRRYSVMELDPGQGHRVFLFAKPIREWRPDEEKEYTVRYGVGRPDQNRCTCKAFRHRSTCAHLESLLSLTNRQPTRSPKKATRENPDPRPPVQPETYLPHNWEQRGKQSFRCVACGMRSFDPILTDNVVATYKCPGPKGGSVQPSTVKPTPTSPPTRANPARGTTGPQTAKKGPSRAERGSARTGTHGSEKTRQKRGKTA